MITKTCSRCNVAFIGHGRRIYCQECKSFMDRLGHQKNSVLKRSVNCEVCGIPLKTANTTRCFKHRIIPKTNRGKGCQRNSKSQIKKPLPQITKGEKKKRGRPKGRILQGTKKRGRGRPKSAQPKAHCLVCGVELSSTHSIHCREHYKSGRTKVCNWNKDVLSKLYWEDGKTLQELGEIYGVTRERVRQVMKGFNIPTSHTRPHKNTLPPLIDRLKEKYSTLDEFFKENIFSTGNKDVSDFILFMSGAKCVECGVTEKELPKNKNRVLHIHHLSYPAKSTKDIKILCGSCHSTLHSGGASYQTQLLIHRDFCDGVNYKDIAQKYEVSTQMVYKIAEKIQAGRTRTRRSGQKSPPEWEDIQYNGKSQSEWMRSWWSKVTPTQREEHGRKIAAGKLTKRGD